MQLGHLPIELRTRYENAKFSFETWPRTDGLSFYVRMERNFWVVMCWISNAAQDNLWAFKNERLRDFDGGLCGTAFLYGCKIHHQDLAEDGCVKKNIRME